MFAGASGLPQLSVSINSTTGDLVERTEFLQGIIEGLDLILRGLLLFKITHHQDAQISRVLAFHMRALELQRPTLPDAASSINGKVVADIVPSPYQDALFEWSGVDRQISRRCALLPSASHRDAP